LYFHKTTKKGKLSQYLCLIYYPIIKNTSIKIKKIKVIQYWGKVFKSKIKKPYPKIKIQYINSGKKTI